MATDIDEKTFKDKVEGDEGLVLVDFWAEWCPPCKALAPILHQLEEEMGDKVKIMKVDVDSNQQLAMDHGVQGIPTVKLFKGGEEVKAWVGLVPKAIYAEAIEANL
jgi:thioredoxin 1